MLSKPQRKVNLFASWSLFGFIVLFWLLQLINNICCKLSEMEQMIWTKMRKCSCLAFPVTWFFKNMFMFRFPKVINFLIIRKFIFCFYSSRIINYVGGYRIIFILRRII